MSRRSSLDLELFCCNAMVGRHPETVHCAKVAESAVIGIGDDLSLGGE